MPPPAPNEVPESIREFIREYDAILLSRHGAMTVGRDVRDAYNKMEKLEHTARVVLAARLQGPLTAVARGGGGETAAHRRRSIRPGGEVEAFHHWDGPYRDFA